MPSVGDPIMAHDLGVSAVLSGTVSLATNSTTLQDVTGMSVSVVAGKTYEVRGAFFASNAAGTAEDIKYGFTFPTGTLRAGIVGGTSGGVSGSSATDMVLAFSAFTSGTTTIGVGLSTNVTVASVTGIYACTTSGTFQVQAAQNTSGANASSLAASSYIILRPL